MRRLRAQRRMLYERGRTHPRDPAASRAHHESWFEARSLGLTIDQAVGLAYLLPQVKKWLWNVLRSR